MDSRTSLADHAQNTEFVELLGGDIYGKPFDAAVLLRLEEAGLDNSVTKTYGGRITIEHVLPQALKIRTPQSRFSPEEHRDLATQTWTIE